MTFLSFFFSEDTPRSLPHTPWPIWRRHCPEQSMRFDSAPSSLHAVRAHRALLVVESGWSRWIKVDWRNHFKLIRP